MPVFQTKLTMAVALAILLLNVGGVIAQPTPPPACTRTYTVQPGDWCDKISAEQGVSTFQLIEANLGAINPACTNLFAGQTLCLGRAGSDCTNVAVVESGQTCESIAADAGITFGRLRENNPNVDEFCTNIYPGEVLCVQA